MRRRHKQTEKVRKTEKETQTDRKSEKDIEGQTDKILSSLFAIIKICPFTQAF